MSSIEKLPSTETPKDKEVSGFFSGLKNRYKNALEAGKQGKGWKEKVLLFFSAFFSKVEQLTEEEKNIKQTALENTESLIASMPKEQLVSALNKEFLGTSPAPSDQEDKKILDSFSSAVVDTAKSNSRDASLTATLLDKPADKLALSEKMIMASFGIKTIVNMRSNPAYNTVDKFAKALDRFEAVTANGKGLAYMKQQRLKEIFKFGKLDFGKFLPIMSYTNLTYMGFGPGPMDAGEFYKKLSSPSFTLSDALSIQGGIAKLFPNTNDDNRAKALMTVNGIILNGKNPTNKQVAELVFYIAPADLVNLSEILKSIK